MSVNYEFFTFSCGVTVKDSDGRIFIPRRIVSHFIFSKAILQLLANNFFLQKKTRNTHSKSKFPE